MIDRIRAIVKRLVRDELSFVDTLAMYPGKVVKQHSDGTIDVKLDDQRFGPGPSRLEIRYGVPGVRAEVPNGARVLVGFENQSRAQPIAHLWASGTPIKLVIETSDEVQIEGAQKVKIDGLSIELNGPGLGVARVGDTVLVGGLVGNITSSSLTVKAGP